MQPIVDRAIRWTSTLILLVAILPGCGGGSDDRGKGSSTPTSGVIRSDSLPPATTPTSPRGDLWFTDQTREAGITFQNVTGSKEKLWIPESIGQGCMFFDYDNDGDLDVYFANGGELMSRDSERIYWNELWRNDGNWHFVDVTPGSGLECPEWSCGTYSVDYDADGFRDVYVTQFGRNRLFRNIDGTGKFEDVSSQVGGDCDSWSCSAAFFDADLDGDLDLYVGNYVDFDIDNPPNHGKPCAWKDLEVCCGPRGLGEAQDVFYEFVDGRFVDATKRAGLQMLDSNGQPRGSYTLGIVTGDFDDDGDPDIYVAVDSRPNLFFENLGKGRFREVASEWQVALNMEATEQAGMGVLAEDLNSDGHLDLFVTNFSHDTNTIYINSGSPDNRYFSDKTSTIGLGGEASYQFLSWGTGAYDFNCDGAPDIMVVSGHVYPQAEGVVNLGTSYAQHNQIFMGIVGTPNFENKAGQSGPAFQIQKVSRGTSFGDIDRDGCIDVAILNLDTWPSLIRNESKKVGHWLGFHLRTSNPGNPEGIGAKLHFTLDNGDIIRREICGGGGYMGSNEVMIHVAFPRERTVREIQVTWPGGKTEQVPPPQFDAWYLIRQGTGTAAPLPPPPVN